MRGAQRGSCRCSRVAAPCFSTESAVSGPSLQRRRRSVVFKGFNRVCYMVGSCLLPWNVLPIQSTLRGGRRIESAHGPGAEGSAASGSGVISRRSFRSTALAKPAKPSTSMTKAPGPATSLVRFWEADTPASIRTSKTVQRRASISVAVLLTSIAERRGERGTRVRRASSPRKEHPTHRSRNSQAIRHARLAEGEPCEAGPAAHCERFTGSRSMSVFTSRGGNAASILAGGARAAEPESQALVRVGRGMATPLWCSD